MRRRSSWLVIPALGLLLVALLVTRGALPALALAWTPTPVGVTAEAEATASPQNSPTPSPTALSTNGGQYEGNSVPDTAPVLRPTNVPNTMPGSGHSTTTVSTSGGGASGDNGTGNGTVTGDMGDWSQSWSWSFENKVAESRTEAENWTSYAVDHVGRTLAEKFPFNLLPEMKNLYNGIGSAPAGADLGMKFTFAGNEVDFATPWLLEACSWIRAALAFLLWTAFILATTKRMLGWAV